MIRWIVTGLSVLVITAGAALAGQSASADNLCFDRHYTPAHLAQHPDQLVTSMTLKLDPDGPVHDNLHWPFYFYIAMTKRGDNHLYAQEGYIDESGVRGIVECDGGGFRLQKIPSGMLLSIDEGIRMARVDDPCGESDRPNASSWFERGKDDHTFQLDKRKSKSALGYSTRSI